MTPVLPPLLSLSSRDMIMPFMCNGHRGTALIDTGATTSYVDPSFLEMVNVTPIERTRVCVVRLADGTTRFVHGIAILEISLSKKWPILRISALPMKQGGQPLLLGADWAQRLGIRIEWPGPTIRPVSVPVYSRNATAEGDEVRPTTLQLTLVELLKQKAVVFQLPSAIPADVPFRHIIRLRRRSETPFGPLLTE